MSVLAMNIYRDLSYPTAPAPVTNGSTIYCALGADILLYPAVVDGLPGGGAVSYSGDVVYSTNNTNVIVSAGGFPALTTPYSFPEGLDPVNLFYIRGYALGQTVVTATDDSGNTMSFTLSIFAHLTVTSVSPNEGSAAGGTSVTITGTGFQPGATVTIGGVAATGVSIVSSTSITATTGAHAAGSVPVAVTNPDGQVATLAAGAAAYIYE